MDDRDAVSLRVPRSAVRAGAPDETFLATYSAVLGVFVPSGGSKWVIEAPYVLRAARVLAVPDGWIVVTYNLLEAVANLLQPFWMLPVLALLGLRARDIMGYTYLVALVLLPGRRRPGDCISAAGVKVACRPFDIAEFGRMV
jgi:hypothetical protein